jgi:plasmid rolling circle replication initiator protein Rep
MTSIGQIKSEHNPLSPLNFLPLTKEPAFTEPFPYEDFEKLKAISRNAADILSRFPEHRQQAKRMNACANVIDIGEQIDVDTGEVTPTLHSAWFCHVPHCPLCGGCRNPFHLRTQALEIIDRVTEKRLTEKRGGVGLISLHPTMKNCPATELRATIKTLTKAGKQLVASLPFVIGSIQVVEITRSVSRLSPRLTTRLSATAHPHLHILLLVPCSYFTDPRQYLSNPDWHLKWRESLGVDYEPRLEVWNIKKKEGFARTVYYTIKRQSVEDLSHMLESPGWFVTFFRHTFRLPLLTTVGVFKGIQRHKKQHTESTSNITRFSWDEGAEKYRPGRDGVSTCYI